MIHDLSTQAGRNRYAEAMSKPLLIRKRVKDVYGDLWNEVAHKRGKQDFKIVGNKDGYITLLGEPKAIKSFLDELDELSRKRNC